MEETVVTTCAPDTITNGAIDGKNQLVSSREVEVQVEAPGDDSGGKGNSNNETLSAMHVKSGYDDALLENIK